MFTAAAVGLPVGQSQLELGHLPAGPLAPFSVGLDILLEDCPTAAE